MVKKINWTEDMVSELGKMTDKTFADKYGLKEGTVLAKRNRMGIHPFGYKYKRLRWVKSQVALLGTDTDKRIAKKLGVTLLTVRKHRIARGIPAYGQKNRGRFLRY